MNTFTVYLGNPTRYEYPWPGLVKEVHAILSPALKFTQQFKTVVVTPAAARPSLKDTDVVVYVVKSQLATILGRKLKSAPDPNHAGLTTESEKGLVASEAYMQGTDAQQLARVVVHELLHNKTGLGNEKLHALKGVCASPPGGPTTENYRLLARMMSKKVPQWLDGFVNQ